MGETYKWFRIEFDDESSKTTLELTPEEQAGLLVIIREAGTLDQYRVEIPLVGKMKDFIQSMLWDQDLFRLKTVLRAAFGDKGEKEHELSQTQHLGQDVKLPYLLVVYNMKKKKPGESD